MKKCKSCQKEIDSKASKCPYCQTDQRIWFAKHPILTVILAIFILGIIGSAAGSDKTKKVGETDSTKIDNTVGIVNTESTNQPTSTTQTVKKYKIGDLVDLDGKTMAVNAVEPYTSKNQFLNPKPGNKFVKVDVTLKNNSKDPYTYNSLEFKLQDNKDYSYSSAITDVEPSLSSGTIQPGETIRGFIGYEIPKDNTQAKLTYTPGFWNLSQIIIDLTQ